MIFAPIKIEIQVDDLDEEGEAELLEEGIFLETFVIFKKKR